MANQPNASDKREPAQGRTVDAAGVEDEVVDGELVDDDAADNGPAAAGKHSDSGNSSDAATGTEGSAPGTNDEIADAELADDPDTGLAGGEGAGSAGGVGAGSAGGEGAGSAGGEGAGSAGGDGAGSAGGVGAGPAGREGTAGTGPGQQPTTTVDRPPLTTSVPQTVSPSVVPGAPGTPTAPSFDYTDDGVPTLDYVRDRIEQRYGTALGGTELAEASAAGRAQRDAEAERARLAQEKLAELRAQVDGSNRTVDGAAPAEEARPGGRQVDPPPAG